MDVFEVIDRRHSYRGAYRDQPVPREHLERIVQAGLQAPSGYNAQDTQFVIVDDPQLIGQIAAVLGGGPVFATAPAMILCLVDREPTTERLAFLIENCSAAVENMLLAATALGYASLWYDGSLRFEGRNDAIGRLVGAPADKVVQVLLPVGSPLETKAQASKKPFAERVAFNRYQTPER